MPHRLLPAGSRVSGTVIALSSGLDVKQRKIWREKAEKESNAKSKFAVEVLPKTTKTTEA